MAQQQISEDAQRFFDSFMKELDLYMQYRDEQDEQKKFELAKQIIGDDELENDDDVDDKVKEMYDGLDRVHYTTKGKDNDNEYNYLEIALALGGPNVRLILNDRWSSAKIEYHRGSEHATYDDFTRDEVDTLMELHNPDY